MRSIYFLLSRFHVLFLFVLMEIFSLYLIYQSHKYQEVTFLNTSNNLAGKVVGFANSFYTFINLGNTNRELTEENTRLKKRIRYRNTYPADTALPEHSESYSFEYIPAKIVNNSISKSINYITLNKGSKDGIQKGWGVVSSNGVVGIVTNVSENFSLVMSVLSVKMLVSVRHKNTNALGNLSWNGKSPALLQIQNISKTLPVKKNDTIVTAGFSSIFPPDIIVGKVKRFSPDESSSFYEVDIEPTNAISRLSYVYVVKNSKKKEIDALESNALNE